MFAKILLYFTFFIKLQNIGKRLLNATQEASPKIAFGKTERKMKNFEKNALKISLKIYCGENFCSRNLRQISSHENFYSRKLMEL